MTSKAIAHCELKRTEDLPTVTKKNSIARIAKTTFGLRLIMHTVEMDENSSESAHLYTVPSGQRLRVSVRRRTQVVVIGDRVLGILSVIG